MNRLIGQAEAWWGGRTLRERRMLMVMVGLLVATAVWLGAVQPVLAWREAAAARAGAAALTLAEVRASVASLGPVRSTTAPPAEGLEPLIRRTAAAAGLEVVTVMSATGQLGVQLSSVSSGPLFAWLAALETDHRLSICALGVTENSDATLNVEAGVAAGSCAPGQAG
jgi:general secretion pathway protein M